jgi:hypothetical protein
MPFDPPSWSMGQEATLGVVERLRALASRLSRVTLDHPMFAASIRVI